MLAAAAILGAGGLGAQPSPSQSGAARETRRAAPRLIYGGDAAFPPYEYQDAQGQPRGFNVELMRLLAQESGASVEFRLGRWPEVMAAFDSGRVDLMSLAHSEARADRYDYLLQTWTLHRGFLMREGRERYPQGLEDLRSEVVACEERGAIHEALLRLPPAQRGVIRPVTSHMAAVRLLQRGEVTVAAGNSLTLRYMAAELGLTGTVDLEVESYPYYLAAGKGRREALDFLREAFERVRYSNRYHAVVERSLVLPNPPRSWLDHWRSFAALGLAIVGVAASAVVWNRALRRKVRLRTRELVGSLVEKDQLASALNVSEARFRGMIEGLNLGVIEHGADGHLRFANKAALTILGQTAPDLFARGALVIPGTLREDGTPVAAGDDPGLVALRTGEAQRDVVVGVPRSGDRLWLLVSAQPERNADGSVRDVLVTFGDITERKRSQEQIRHLAYHDSLTGLPNRELFLDRLSVALAHAVRYQSGLAVAFVDLDHFKVVNYSLGHSIGDQLLRSVGQRIRAALREEDTVARLGGDEFTALLPGTSDPDAASRIADKLQHAIKQPLLIEGRELSISASIGIGLFPADGEDADTLLKNADTAMYRSKELGRDQFQFYTAAMGQRVMLHLDLEGRLRKALQAGSLMLHYQPFVDLETGRVQGVEALLRWNDAERGMIPPDDFIPLAEVTGLIGELSEWVLRTAASEHAQIVRATRLAPLLAVNLSARQFHRGGVVELIKGILRDAAFDPGHLEIEITETIAMQDQVRTVETLQQLKDLGVRISIDDFGTGYSSLSYLHRFPIDTIKIDRSFVRGVATDKTAAGIVRAIIAVARELNLTVVAEGVETEEQLRYLRQLRCDMAQGFLLGRPTPLESLAGVFASVPRIWAAADDTALKA